MEGNPGGRRWSPDHHVGGGRWSACWPHLRGVARTYEAEREREEQIRKEDRGEKRRHGDVVIKWNGSSPGGNASERQANSNEGWTVRRLPSGSREQPS